MKKPPMMKIQVLTICLMSVAALLATHARADDFAPPPWLRGAPLSTAAEWEFLTDEASHFGPDGNTVATVVGDFTGPQAASVFANPSGDLPLWSPGDGDGEWIAGTQPMFIEFEIGNWVDLKPVKLFRMQVTFGGPAPSIFSIGAIDAAGPVVIVPTGTTLFSTTHILFEYELFPNPDFELITLEIPPGGSVDQVVVDTISIPEPSTLTLAALGLLGLLAHGRRRRS